MDPRADMDTGENKSLWPMVRIEKFLGRQFRLVTFLAVPILLSGPLATLSLSHRIQQRLTRRQQ
jgi:hypothetical protein